MFANLTGVIRMPNQLLWLHLPSTRPMARQITAKAKRITKKKTTRAVPKTMVRATTKAVIKFRTTLMATPKTTARTILKVRAVPKIMARQIAKLIKTISQIQLFDQIRQLVN